MILMKITISNSLAKYRDRRKRSYVEKANVLPVLMGCRYINKNITFLLLTTTIT